MKKRIFAFLLAAFMLTTSFTLTGCFSMLLTYNESSETVSETTKSEESEEEKIDAKGLFESTLESLIPPTDENFISDLLQSSDTTKSDAILSIDANFSKLIVDSAELTKSTPFSLKYKSATDIESNAATSNYDISMLGENITLGALTYGNKVYLTDFLGINSKPINANEAISIAPIDNSTIDIVHLLRFFKDAISKVTEANIDETMFSAENKDASVNGKEYNDATVITLSFSDGVIRRIAHEFIDEIEGDDAVAKALGIDNNTESIMKEVEKLQAIRLINTVSGGKSVALTLEVAVVAEDERGNDIINTSMIILSYDEHGFCLAVGTLGANRQISLNHEIKTLTYYKEDGNERIAFDIYDVRSDYTAIELNGSINENCRKGKLTFKSGKDYITCDYHAETNENYGKIELSDFVDKKSGKPTEEKYNIALEYTKDDRGIFADIAVDINGELDDLNITTVGTISLSYEPQEVTINDITEKCEEFDYEYFEKTLPLKFPNITAFFDDMYKSAYQAPDELEISIDLPMTFKSYPSEIENNYVNFYSNDAWIYILRYDESEFADFNAYKLKHFAENMRLGHLDFKPSILTEVDGIYYYSFTHNNGYIYQYDIFYYKGDDEFWAIQFSCAGNDYTKYKDRFLKWAKSVDPTGQTKYDNSLDGILDGAKR